MKNKWILDVLFDLRSYAQENGLTALAEYLEDASLLAATEIASQEEKAASAISATEPLYSNPGREVV